MTRPCIPWSDFEDAALKRFKADGVANQRAGELLGRAERAIASRVTILGIAEERDWSLAEDMLFDRGWNNTDIAAHTGRTVAAVKNRRSALNARDNSVKGDDAYVAALMAQGGFTRLSEKPAREGPRVCLPLLRAS